MWSLLTAASGDNAELFPLYRSRRWNGQVGHQDFSPKLEMTRRSLGDKVQGLGLHASLSRAQFRSLLRALRSHGPGGVAKKEKKKKQLEKADFLPIALQGVRV